MTDQCVREEGTEESKLVNSFYALLLGLHTILNLVGRVVESKVVYFTALSEKITLACEITNIVLQIKLCSLHQYRKNVVTM